MRKTLALLLTALSGTSAAESTTVEETTADPRFVDELPTDKKYDGYDFVVLTNLRPEFPIAWKVIDVYAESETGERITDAVYEYGVDTYGIVLQYCGVYPLALSTGAKAVEMNKDGTFEVKLDSLQMMDAM